MYCIDACCYGDGDVVGSMVCHNYSSEEIRDALENRDRIPYKVVEKTVSGFTVESVAKDETFSGYAGFLARQLKRFAAKPSVYTGK